jgi:fatty acid desaturase
MSSNTQIDVELGEPHQPPWVSRVAFQLLVFMLAGNQLAMGAALYYGHTWLAVLLVVTGSHLMHGVLIGFHEASHGLLRTNRRFNEFDGLLIGCLSFMSFSLYRAAHQSHHAHLGTEKDEELWPFVDTKVPRWGRVLAAVLELTIGIFFTPFLFIRTFFRKGSPIRNKKLRRRIWMEFGGIVVFWTVVLSTVAWLGMWKYFIWMYAVPAVIAANLQSWRKYIEHVGLTGSTINAATRSIIADGPMGRLVAFSLLHEPFHGVHHRHSGLPHAELPQRAAILQPTSPEEHAPFRSYTHAMTDLMRKLRDPRVGPQWNHADEKLANRKLARSA